MPFWKKRNKSKNKQVKESMQELSQIIDCSEDTFRDHINACSKGYLMSLHNLFVITYNRTKETKDELVSQVKLGNVDSVKATKTIEGLYSELMKIEQKVFILREYLLNTHKVNLYPKQDDK